MDRNKVIKGLECCASNGSGACAVCDWADPEEYECFTNLAKAALELLKEQGPMEPTEPDEANTKYCGACGSAVGYEVLEPSGMDYVRYNYCPECGRAVKWE